MNYEPIYYEYELPVRFTDLDPYGHVNVSVYLDYVITSRWLFLEKTMGKTVDDLLKTGIAFFTRRSQVDYLRPILFGQIIFVRSFISVSEESKLVVEFEIRDQTKETLHSRGTLEFAVVDIKTQKRTSLPEDAIPYFWKKA